MNKIIKYFILTIILILVLFPVFWLFLISFKNRLGIFETPPSIFSGLTFDNYLKLFEDDRLVTAFFNSFIVALFSSVISIVVSSLAAYSLTIKVTKKNENIFNIFLSLLVLPPIVIALPIYMIFNSIGLSNNIFAIIIIHIGLLVPFGVLILTSYFKRVNVRIEEISKIHQIPFTTFFFRIFLKEVKGALILTGFLMVLISWNEFLFAMIITNTSSQTIPVLVDGMVTSRGVLWGKVSAIALLSSIPVIGLGIYFNKQLVSGFTFGFIKIR